MAAEAASSNVPDAATAPFPPGPLIRIGHGALVVDIAPQAGGRVAQVSFEGSDWLVGHDADNAAMIAWGSFPMLPWAGRIRRGTFDFGGHDYQLAANLGDHAIHGVAFGLSWQVDEHSATHAVLSLALPEDSRWPFGGSARQRIEVDGHQLRMTLTVTADARAMPVTMGWHPWLQKPDRLDFRPDAYYPRDGEGIAHLPLAAPPSPPWDDCFLNGEPVVMQRARQQLRLTSSCDHWVVYDEPSHATCVEPQTGPPDAVNLGLAPCLEPGASLSAWFRLEWSSLQAH